MTIKKKSTKNKINRGETKFLVLKSENYKTRIRAARNGGAIEMLLLVVLLLLHHSHVALISHCESTAIVVESTPRSDSIAVLSKWREEEEEEEKSWPPSKTTTTIGQLAVDTNRTLPLIDRIDVATSKKSAILDDESARRGSELLLSANTTSGKSLQLKSQAAHQEGRRQIGDRGRSKAEEAEEEVITFSPFPSSVVCCGRQTTIQIEGGKKQHFQDESREEGEEKEENFDDKLANHGKDTPVAPPIVDELKHHPVHGRASNLLTRITRSNADDQHGDDSEQSNPAAADDLGGGGFHSLAKQKLLKSKSTPSIVSGAVLNGVASLACDIQPASSDDLVALILWYKDDSLAPIYTVDARKVNSLDRAKISFDERYSSRLQFRLKSRPALLQLSGIRQEDEGDYRCRVDFKRGRTVNTIISLQIIVPPTELAIYLAAGHPQSRSANKQLSTSYDKQQQQQNRLDGLIGPFNEGDELELVCLVGGGKPRPQITWRRDFNVINSTQQTIDKEGTSVALKISPLNKSHLLSIFTCLATNNNLTSPLQSSITLDLNLKPQEISLRQLNPGEPLLVGQTVTFECSTYGSRPQATIYWLFQSIRHDAPMNVDQQQTSSRLSLTLQRSFNQQLLTCVAENPRIASASSSPSSSSKQTSIKLDVQYAPQLSIRLDGPQKRTTTASNNHSVQVQDSSAEATIINGDTDDEDSDSRPPAANNNYLQEGNDIYLTCQLDSNPRPTKPIQWRFNGRLLSSSSSSSASAQATAFQQQNIIINNQSLVLRKVSRSQSGLYSCEATNGLGLNTSKPLELNIRHAPICSHQDEILLFEVRLNETIQIDCSIQANPSKSVHFSWFSSAGSAKTTADNYTSQEQLLLQSLASNRNGNEDEKEEADDDSYFDQIDESSSRLSFRVRDERDLSKLIKCKAKNEIGLQQRACLFQLIPSRMPKLKHSCSLTRVQSSQMQLNCRENDHLKTNEFELTQSAAAMMKHQPAPGSNQHNWLELADSQIRQQSRRLMSSMDGDEFGGGVGGRSPQFRLVHPPQWLLVELYKFDQQQPVAGAKDHDHDDDHQYELAAYLVVGAPNQLARIKSLVEANKLFHLQPKDIYYVRAKQQQQNSSSTPQTAAANESSLLAEQHKVQQQQPRDETIQLPSEFNFTIPSLTAKSKYKLLIYGQNLSNKTRDLLVLRGETLPDELVSSSSSPGNQRRDGADQQLDQENSTASISNNNPESIQRDQPPPPPPSRSISMRSGDADLVDSAGQAEQQQQQQQLLTEQTYLGQQQQQQAGRSSNIQQQHLASSDNFDKQLKQLAVYKDYAINYARQKPLLAIPIALASFILLLIILVWFGVSFVNLILGGRRRGGSQRQRRRGSDDDQQQRDNSNEKLSSLYDDEKQQQQLGSNGFGRVHNQMSGSESAGTTATNTTTATATTNNDDSFTTTSPTDNHHQHCHPDDANDLSSNTAALLLTSSGNTVELDPSQFQQLHHHSFLIDANDDQQQQQSNNNYLLDNHRRTIYAIDTGPAALNESASLLDAIALEQIYNKSNNNNRSCFIQTSANHHHQLVSGSLNRQGLLGNIHEQPYFAVAATTTTAGQQPLVMNSHHVHQQQQQDLPTNEHYDLFFNADQRQQQNQPTYLKSINRTHNRTKTGQSRKVAGGGNDEVLETTTTADHHNNNYETNTNFSSTTTECSSSFQDSHHGSGNGRASQRSHNGNNGRRSHVAFDLSSNDEQQQPTEKLMMLHHHQPAQPILSNARAGMLDHHQQQLINSSLQRRTASNHNASARQSDSGMTATSSSSSGRSNNHHQPYQGGVYTGLDSGHGSPATNDELNSSCNSSSIRLDNQHYAAMMGKSGNPLGGNKSRVCDRHDNSGRQLPAIVDRGAPICCCQTAATANRTPLAIDCQVHGPPARPAKSSLSGNNNNVQLMLMELSPGSQESTQSTLLQSIDSLEPQVDHHQHHRAQLPTAFGSTDPTTILLNRNHHQMATSFGAAKGAHQTGNNHHSKD